MSFADARRKKGLSQKVVAEKMGVDQSTVCLWECRKTTAKRGSNQGADQGIGPRQCGENPERAAGERGGISDAGGPLQTK